MGKLNSKFEALLLTNDLLDRLVASHNKVFGGSIRKIFKPIAYDELAMELSDVIEGLSALRGDYPQFDETAVPGLNWSQVDRTYFEFCERVIQTYSLLTLICLRLHKKARGESYPMAEYDHDVNTYKQMVSEYQPIGQVLNSQLRM